MSGNTYADFNAPKNHSAERPRNGGLKKPVICEIGHKTWLINEFGCDNIYVLEGEDRSLIIDCGMGYCNLREIAEALTQKPYDVAVTHAHPDHIGMMRQFERIYINEKEITDAPPFHGTAGGIDAINYLCRPDFDMNEFEWNNRLHIGNWELWSPDESCICRGSLDTEIRYIKEGDSFDLGGGRIVTAYDLPGHTPGHMYFIDSGARIAFTGDCVNFNNGTAFHAASTHIRYLQKFRSMYGKAYDRIFTGHSTYCGGFDVSSQDIRITDSLIEVFRAYLRDEAELSEVPHHLFPDKPPRKVMSWGEGEFRVQVPVPPRKWEDGEEHIIP